MVQSSFFKNSFLFSISAIATFAFVQMSVDKNKQLSVVEIPFWSDIKIVRHTKLNHKIDIKNKKSHIDSVSNSLSAYKKPFVNSKIKSEEKNSSKLVSKKKSSLKTSKTKDLNLLSSVDYKKHKDLVVKSEIHHKLLKSKKNLLKKYSLSLERLGPKKVMIEGKNEIAKIKFFKFNHELIRDDSPIKDDMNKIAEQNVVKNQFKKMSENTITNKMIVSVSESQIRNKKTRSIVSKEDLIKDEINFKRSSHVSTTTQKRASLNVGNQSEVSSLESDSFATKSYRPSMIPMSNNIKKSARPSKVLNVDTSKVENMLISANTVKQDSFIRDNTNHSMSGYQKESLKNTNDYCYNSYKFIDIDPFFSEQVVDLKGTLSLQSLYEEDKTIQSNKFGEVDLVDSCERLDKFIVLGENIPEVELPVEYSRSKRVLTPLFNRSTFNNLLAGYPDKKRTIVIFSLSETVENIEQYEYQKNVKTFYLNDIYKVVSKEDSYEYIVVVGLEEGNRSFYLKGVDGQKTLYTKYLKNERIHFENVNLNDSSTTLSLLNLTSLSHGNYAFKNLKDKDVVSFSTDMTSKLKRNGTYEFNKEKHVNNLENYYFIKDQQNSYFIKARGNSDVLIPDDYMAGLAYDQLGAPSQLNNVCIIQINFNKSISEFNINAQSPMMNMRLSKLFLDSDGIFYKEPSSETKNVFLMGEEAGIVYASIKDTLGQISNKEIHCVLNNHMIMNL